METLFNSPDKFKSRFATVDGYKTHFLEAGRQDADRLLLVHGGACEIGLDCYRWYPNFIPFAEHFHVYAIDELGHGQTDPPRNPADLANVRVRAEHVVKFIEELKLAPVHLAGQSQGGWIVTYITLQRPDLVDKLILIDSGSTAGSAVKTGANDPDTVEIDGKKTSIKDGELPFFKELFEPGTKLPKEGLTNTREGIRKYVGSFCYDKSRITEEFLDHLKELSDEWNGLYMKYRGKEHWGKTSVKQHQQQYFIDGVHIRDLVQNIKKPTLVIWGKNSVKGVDPGIAMYKRIPDAQMHIFDEASHFLWLDHPEDFNGLVTWFLTKDR